MGSQTDLDQGGTFRQWIKTYMGPSVGWVSVPVDAVLEVNTAGGTILARGTSLVLIGPVAADLNINLPSSKASPQGPQAIPGQWIINPVTILDVGGLADQHIYRIYPAVGETISGLASVDLATPRGTIVLIPILDVGGWNLGP